ncbi:MAG: hypothetical protein ACI9JN_002320 [Bacteroidia bacterium]|jgi:hypothetical protein
MINRQCEGARGHTEMMGAIFNVKFLVFTQPVGLIDNVKP